MRGFSSALRRWGTQPATEMDEAGERLITEAKAAARLRAYAHDPDVAALTVERTRERVERVLLTAMICGLLYTTVNVQAFVAGAASGLAWWAAWLVEPFITAGVLGLLRIEQVARRNGVVPGAWVRVTRWAAFGATYVFNTWMSWFGPSLVPSDIVKHSVIPVLVFFFAEGLTDGRDALTKAADLVSARRLDQIVRVPDPRPPVVVPIPPAPVPAPRPAPAPEPEPPAVVQPPPVVVPRPKPPVNTDARTPEAAQPVAQRLKAPRGYLKEVAIPEAYRRLAEDALARGLSLDTISCRDVDRAAGTNNYVKPSMIKPIRDGIEKGREVRTSGGK
jgi:hypothetical protein